MRATYANTALAYGGEYRKAITFIEIRTALSGIFETVDGVLVFVRLYYLAHQAEYKENQGRFD